MKLLMLDHCASLGVAAYRTTMTTELVLKVYFGKKQHQHHKIIISNDLMGTGKRTIQINVIQ